VLFDTPVYFFFLTIIVILYWRLRWRQQNYFLLAASYLFYGWWDWRFLSLILSSTVVDFFCARYIERSENTRRRRALLSLSVVVNLTFLGFFKYFNFFADSLVAALHGLRLSDVPSTTLRIILPAGISFYTFQELAYIVDVYKGRLKSADSLVDYALFISFFPHLIAGPIQRPSHLLPQVQRIRQFEPEKFFNGILLILSGLFRKCVIADNCALLAEGAFSGKLGGHSLPVLAIGTYAFAWQIYGDFSGYSDMARGSAQLLGFHFMVNFRQPYLARSLQDFWRRWHISLSTWLRDYLYIPLGGNRDGEVSTYRNLMSTMLLGGLWHGANWTFVAWGGLHGLGLALERAFGGVDGRAGAGSADGAARSLLRLGPWIARILLFHMVCLGWIFFRADSLSNAVRFLNGIAIWAWRSEFATAFAFLALFSIPLFALDLALEGRNEEFLGEHAPAIYRVAFGGTLIAVVALFAANQVSAFIYFQF
jgi:D-alanyl-lipoteichoic acid acyltransferase DltB (MBOAT superfamily)